MDFFADYLKMGFRLQSDGADSAGRGAAAAAPGVQSCSPQRQACRMQSKQKGILILYVNKTMQIGEINRPPKHYKVNAFYVRENLLCLSV